MEYAGCVILDYNKSYSRNIKDCKLLNDKQLEEAVEEIRDKAIAVGVGIGTIEMIDKKGTGHAIDFAMKEAYANLIEITDAPEILLVDYRQIDITSYPKPEVVAGPKFDKKYRAVQAASCIAKYTHDQIARRAHKEYPEFEWDKNKGAFHKRHENLIIKHGLTPHHRKSWCKRIEERRGVQLKKVK